jgi:hypothetical protein
MTTKEVILPYSGKTATLRRPTGHDMVKAELLCGESEGKPFAMQMAIINRITMIDGKTLPFEDFLDLDMEDLNFLGKQELTRESPPTPS